ncbi:MAG: lipoyl synthase [Candidatus Omnitrophota bacterium]
MATEIGCIRKPAWLNKKINFKKCESLNVLLKKHGLNTVCQEAKCPNISECFSEGVATFLILGNVCTRSCDFCAVSKGVPQTVDLSEPLRVAEAVKALSLRHVVVTSVTRDDLGDGGSRLFANTIDEVKKLNKDTTIEVLVPDFKGEKESVKVVMDREPHIFAHNLETVPRFYQKVRKKANYSLSLDVLKKAKEINRNIRTKSGIMVGLGEKREEVLKTITDIKMAGCDFLSIGQYLAPSLVHFPVKEYVEPSKFEYYKYEAMKLGFVHVESASYVRSSYLAAEYIKQKPENSK